MAILSTVAILCASGCSEQDKKVKDANDVKALQQLVDIPIDLRSARWELFGTPEYDRGVPGPTDYMTLVAEIEPLTSAGIFTTGTNDNSIYIVPEAARPWLSSEFRSILQKSKNANIELATAARCHAYSTKMRKSGQTVGGFSCEKSGHVLLYLSIF